MPSPPSRHTERLIASAPWWAMVVLLSVTVGWLLLVATTPLVALASAVVALMVFGTALWRYGALRIIAEPGSFRAGEASLAAPHLGVVESLDPVAWRSALSDAGVDRAFLLTRPWIDRGVRVEVVDPGDPTPYWLVSTRRPDSVARTVGHTGDPNRRSSDGQEAHEEDRG